MLKNYLKKELIYFREVYLTGSMTQAAISLNTGQSGISKVILDLEQEYNKPLFIRTKQGARPTTDGHALFQEIEKILGVLDKAPAKSGQWSLLIGCHPSIGIDFLPNFVTSFFEDHDVELSFRLQNSRRSVADIIKRELDLAIVANPVKYKDLVIRHLSKQAIRLFESRPSQSERATIVHPDQIGLLKSLKSLKPKHVIELSDYEMIGSMVARNGDIFNGLLPEHVAERYGLSPASKALHIANISAVFRADHPKVKFLRTLV